MNDLDPSDPLIAALSTLADPLRPPLPPIETIVERHERRRRGRARRSATLAALAVAASVTIIAGVTAGDDTSDDDLEVRAAVPTTYSVAPLPHGVSDGRGIGHRRLDGLPITVEVDRPTSVVGGQADDARQGPYGPFGPDHLLHRSARCAPRGVADAEYSVNGPSGGKTLQVFAADLPLPAVVDLTPYQAVTSGGTGTSAWLSVLILTDRSPLTYTARFADGSVDRITSDDPAVAMFGRAYDNLDDAAVPDGEPAATVTATDSRGRIVWTSESVSSYPWLTDPSCNHVDPTSIGTAASPEVVAAAEQLVLPIVQPGPLPSEIVVDPTPAFTESIAGLRATFLNDPGTTASIVAVRVTDEGEVWAYVWSTSSYIGLRWIRMVPTDDGWRTTRQSICSIPPPGFDAAGCDDVVPVFDPADPA